MPILYKNASDGMIHVCVPAISVDDPEGFTKEQSYQRALLNSIPADATSITQVDALPAETDLSSDFRNAWSAVHPDGSVDVDTQGAASIVDAKLQVEMDGYVQKLNLYTKLGKDTTAIQASITNCSARYAQLSAVSAKGAASAQDLATLKSLLPVASAAASVVN